MPKIGKVQAMMHLALLRLLHPHQRYPCCLRTRVQFQRHVLHCRVLQASIFDPNDKGHPSMDDCSTTLEQKPGTLFGAGHQRLLVLIYNKH